MDWAQFVGTEFHGIPPVRAGISWVVRLGSALPADCYNSSPRGIPCRTWTKLCCSCAKKEMECRRESSSWIKRWRLWAVSMDYQPATEVFSPPAGSRKPCQPQRARESPQRNGSVGRSGKQLGAGGKSNRAFARLFSHLLTLCVDTADSPRKYYISGTISVLDEDPTWLAIEWIVRDGLLSRWQALATACDTLPFF